IKLADKLWVGRSYQVGGSGILGELGDGESQFSIRDLCILMIVLSDNTATNMLIDLVGMENVNRTLVALGLNHTKLRRKMMDSAARARGDENISTPHEANRIMEILYKGEFISRDVCEQMLDILKKPKAGAINAAAPESVPVAFKSGDLPGVATEWAIVFLKERPYILVTMGNYGSEKTLQNTIREISQIIYDYYWRLARASQYGTYIYPD
ncbi:MAG TPA: serine hydrolase, partial [bacterium]